MHLVVRHLAMPLFVGLALAMAAVVPAPAGADEREQAARATVSSTFLSATPTDVVSTKGKKLKVSLFASRSDSGRLAVNLSSRTRAETHGWSFVMPKGDLAISSTGAGSLRTGAAGGYGKVQLRVETKGKMKKQFCQGQLVSKSRPVVVKGIFYFNTGSTWGAVGSKTRRFVFEVPSRVLWSYATTATCGGGGGGGGGGGSRPPCDNVITWSAFSDGRFLTGRWKPGAAAGQITGSRSVQLSRPAGATRTDYAVAKSDPLSFSGTTTDQPATLGVAGKSGASGRATLASSVGSTTSVACGDGTRTRTDRNWYGASYANGGTKLTVKMTAFGDVSIPNSESGAYFRKTSTS